MCTNIYKHIYIYIYERFLFLYVVVVIVCCAQGLMVAIMIAEMSFDDLESMGSGASLPLQPSERLHELSMPSKSFTSVRARHALQKYHLCLSIAPNSLLEALNVKARSPNKFMDVSDMQVSDEDGYMTRNVTITANSKIVNVRIWIHPVISKIVFQPLHTDTDMSKNPINGVETTVRDGRGFNMTLDAHFFELVHQKTSLRTDDFYNHSEKNHRCLLH